MLFNYASRSIVGNRVTSLGNGNFDFEPDVPVKITYALFDLPPKEVNRDNMIAVIALIVFIIISLRKFPLPIWSDLVYKPHALFDLPPKEVNMSLCQLRTQIHDTQKGYQDCFIEFRNIPIPQRPVAVSKPFKGEWFLKGNNIEGKLSLDFYEKSFQFV